MLKLLRRITVGVLGLVIVIVGIALLFLPGPGTLTIIAGLALLGTEFELPRRWVRSLRDRVRRQE